MENPSATQKNWRSRISNIRSIPSRRKNIVDDGFFSHMAKGARFTPGLEFPIIEDPGQLPDPINAIPFSKIKRSKDFSECVVFFENDPLFSEALLATNDYLDVFRRHPCVATPDCSLYRDAPLAVQIGNLYLNRLFGSYCQRQDINVIPTCRWGDERTYTNSMFDIPPAFDGLPKNSVYWVGTYGVSKHREDKRHLRAGLENMIGWLSPKKIYLYGSMPADVFDDLREECEFLLFKDWVSQMKGEANGQRN